MNLGGLHLHQVVVEIRYPATYRGFDHAGELVDQILQAMPNWELAQANPSAFDLSRPAYGLSAHVATNVARVTQTQTEEYFNLEDGKRFFDDYLNILAPVLTVYRVKEFSRIGYRRMLNYGTATPEAALEEWRSLPFVKLDLPDGAPDEYQAGAVAFNLQVSDDLRLLLQASNIEVDANMAGTQLSWSHKKVYRLPSSQRRAGLDALMMAEKKLQFLPRHGLQMDLDWSREDWENAQPEDIAKFVALCDKKRDELLPLLLEKRR